MSRKPARCTLADIRRAWSVARAGGPDVAVDILPDGTIRLHKAATKGGFEEAQGNGESPRVMF